MTNLELLISCPECLDVSERGRLTPACYANPDKDTYFCHRCKATGKFSDLEEPEVIDEVEKRSLDVAKLSCLPPFWPKSRFPGFDEAPSWVDIRAGENGEIVLPVKGFDGELRGIKKRLPSGDQRYVAEPGSKSGCYFIPFSRKTNRILVTEGEFDAISARLLGFKGDCLALQSTNLSEEVTQQLKRNYSEIVLALDADDVGRKAAHEIRAALLGKRVKDISTTYGECKDINEILQRLGKDAAKSWIRVAAGTEAECASIAAPSLVAEMNAFLADRKNTRGTKTGFRMLDDRLGGGLRPGELTIVHAAAKTGKTTFINQLLFNLISNGSRAAVASFEMKGGKEILPSLISIGLQHNIRKESEGVALKAIEKIIERDMPYLSNLIFYDNRVGMMLDSIENWVEALTEESHADAICLDHSLFMLRSPKDSDENLNLYKRLSLLAQYCNTHIIVVVQAPKLQHGQMLGLDTTYGGVAAGMFTHNFITLERTKGKPQELKVRLQVARYPGARPSDEPMLLFYDYDTCTLSE